MRFAFLLLVTSLSASAVDVSARGRAFVMTCAYFSSVEADFEVSLRDQDAPAGSKAVLIAGLNGEELFGEDPIIGHDTKEYPMREISPGHWQVSFEKQLHARGRPVAYTELSFRFRVYPPSARAYEPIAGNYVATVWKRGTGKCISRADDKPEFTDLKLELQPVN